MATNNLRNLSADELKLVSGGNITVTGSRDDYWDNNPWSWLQDYYGYEDLYDSGYGGGGSGGTEDHSLAEATETALQITEAKHNVLQDLLNKYGPDAKVQLPNGELVKLGDLNAGVGQMFTYLQAGVTIGELVDGGKNIHDAVNFLFGVTVTAMAVEAGAGAVFAGALGFAAEYAAGHILEWMETMGQLNQQLSDYFNAEIAQWVQDNSTIQPGTYDNPMEMLRGMFGWPTYQHDGYNIP